MSASVDWLAALLLRSVLVLGAAAVVAAVLRRQSAAARHAVWAGALLALLAMPALTLLLPRLRVPLLAAPDPVRTELNVFEAVASPANGERGGSGGPGSLYSSPADGRDVSDRIAMALVALWLGGVLVLGCRRAISERRSRQLVRAARPADAPLERLCAGESARLALRHAPPLRMSGGIRVPAVAGVLRPVVLLPLEADMWSEADAASALVHELGHVTRRDSLVNLLADLAAILYWCNPAVWVARARLRVESERACDDLVLACGTDPERYASLLLRVARADSSRALPSAVTAMARPHQLETRLLAVLDDHVTRAPLARRITTLLGATGLIIALPACALTFQAAPVRDGPMAPEPDRAGDALALPASERLPALSTGFAVPAGAVAALQGPDSALVARLITALEQEPQHDGDLVRDRAAWALAQARDRRLVEPLLTALRAPDWRVQSYAAWALVTSRDPRAVPPLLELLDHPVWRLRAMAAAALRESADPRAIDAMSTALGDPAWQVRLEAVGYFLSLGSPEMAERVRAHRNDRHIAVRLAARRAAHSP